MRAKLLINTVGAPATEVEEMPSKFVIVFVTVGKEDEATAIARRLVDESLAACVSMLKQKSLYNWKGETIEDEEILLIIKTCQRQFPALRDRVLSLHSYEVPEIISITIQEGHEAYLKWIASTVNE